MSGADQLIEVLVARHDHGAQAAGGGGGRQRTDDVVRLVAVAAEDRYAERAEDLLDSLDRTVEVLLQLLVELFARGLVRRVALLAKRHAEIVDPAEVRRGGAV